MISRSASKSISKVVTISQYKINTLHNNSDNNQKIEKQNTQWGKIDISSKNKIQDNSFLGFINETIGEWPAWNKFMDSNWMKQTGKNFKVKLIKTLHLCLKNLYECESLFETEEVPSTIHLTRDGYSISYDYMFDLKDGNTYFYPRLSRGLSGYREVKEVPKYPDGEKVEVYVMPTDLALQSLRIIK